MELVHNLADGTFEIGEAVPPGQGEYIGNPDIIVPNAELCSDGRKVSGDDRALETRKQASHRQAHNYHPES